MADISFEKTEDGIGVAIKAILTRGKTLQSYLNRFVYPKYQQAQIKRWESENSSEGGTWKPLSPLYVIRKRVKYASYPGAGNALMVATGTLAAAAQGRGPGALKIVTEKSLTVGVDVGTIRYAKFASAARSFMDFSEATIQDMVDGIARFIVTGKVS